MKIIGPVAATAVKAKRDRKSRAAHGEFVRCLDGGESSVDAPTPTAIGGIDAVVGVVAAQVVDDEATTARREVRCAEQLLDRLEDLRRALLVGTASKEHLFEVARLARSQRQDLAPALAAVIDDIKLRAEIELAKRTRNLSP